MTSSVRCKTFDPFRRSVPVAHARPRSRLRWPAARPLQPMEATGALGVAAAPSAEADWRRAAEAWGERYRANPNDPDAAINYAQALRGNGQRSQAVAVLEQASIQNPKHMGLLGAYGRALADVGNYKQALDVLNRAHTPDQPDWRILSVQGAVLDQMGRHEEAQRYYAHRAADRAGRAVGPVQSRSVLRAVQGPRAGGGDAAEGGRRTRASIRGCGRTSRWWSGCRDASPKPRASRRPTCRPTKRPPTSPICGRCWRSRTA